MNGTTELIKATDIATGIKGITRGCLATSAISFGWPTISPIMRLGDKISWGTGSSGYPTVTLLLENDLTITVPRTRMNYYTPTAALKKSDKGALIRCRWGDQMFEDRVSFVVVDPNDLDDIKANVPEDIEKCPWWMLSALSQAGCLLDYYPIGSRKLVTGGSRASNGFYYEFSTFYATIIAYDHNKDLESPNHPHCAHLLLASVYPNTPGTFGAVSYSSSSGLNIGASSPSTNTGGWANTNLRKTKFVENASMAVSCLPKDLQSSLIPITKYTDNVGGGSSDASNVTATEEYVTLLSEYEVYGTTTFSNPHEAEKQVQYEFFANQSNLQFCMSCKGTGTKTAIWTRSPSISDGTKFVTFAGTGEVTENVAYASGSRVVYPCYMPVVFI